MNKKKTSFCNEISSSRDLAFKRSCIPAGIRAVTGPRISFHLSLLGFLH